MAIGKKPKSYIKDIQTQYEEKAVNFINKVDKVLIDSKKQLKQPVMIRFEQELLTRIDMASRHRGVSRSSWIHYMISKVLDHDEK